MITPICSYLLCVCSIKTIILSVFFCFTVSFLLHLPVVIYTKVHVENNYTQCYPKFPWERGQVYYPVFASFELYVVPVIIIMACYIQILLQVWQKTSGGTESAQAHARALRRKKKITRMVFIVVVLFAFCWAPIHTFNIMSASGAKVIMANVGIAQWWKIFFLTLAYANSCINPFVYAFTTTSFKKYFKSVFGAACGQYSREGHAMSISMETKTERITTNSTKEDSSL